MNLKGLEILTYPNKPKTHRFNMAVPYNDQNDNSPNKGQGAGWRQCNLTSAAMIVKYLIPSLWTQYTDFANGMQDVLKPFGDTTDHDAITAALRTLGIESYFTRTGSREDLSHSLYNGIPALTGCDYKESGHMFVITGRTPEGYLVHCPYGLRKGASDEWIAIGNNSGRDDAVSMDLAAKIIFDQGDERGWIRLITSVKGVATGVKAGL